MEQTDPGFMEKRSKREKSRLDRYRTKLDLSIQTIRHPQKPAADPTTWATTTSYTSAQIIILTIKE